MGKSLFYIRPCSFRGAELLQSRGLLKLDKNDFKFLWVIEFPLMLMDEEAGRYVSSHHPFTAPVPEDIELLKTDPVKYEDNIMIWF